MSEEKDKGDDEKDTELDMLAEQELIRLTRQFRVRDPSFSSCMQNDP